MMRKMFEKFAEVLLIDATYKLNELRLPLFVLMSVDDNGEGEIMSLWIVSITWIR
jgi:zinc finger SWIM domain-containing protein 3